MADGSHKYQYHLQKRPVCARPVAGYAKADRQIRRVKNPTHARAVSQTIPMFLPGLETCGPSSVVPLLQAVIYRCVFLDGDRHCG
jgi:hypothetical protein